MLRKGENGEFRIFYRHLKPEKMEKSKFQGCKKRKKSKIHKINESVEYIGEGEAAAPTVKKMKNFLKLGSKFQNFLDGARRRNPYRDNCHPFYAVNLFKKLFLDKNVQFS